MVSCRTVTLSLNAVIGPIDAWNKRRKRRLEKHMRATIQVEAKSKIEEEQQ
jgi:hypothetical protein